MSLTRKHYVMLAEALAEVALKPSEHGTVTAWVMWLNCRDKIADVLAADNPAFDRARFIKAAQGDKE